MSHLALLLAALVPPPEELAPLRDAPTTPFVVQQKSTSDDAFAALLPADAYCVLRIQSLDDFDGALAAIGRSAGKPPPSTGLKFLGSTLQCPGPLREIERRSPIAIAFSPTPGSMRPTTTFVLPVANATEYLAKLPSAARRWSGERARGYLALSQLDSYTAPATPARIGLELPRGVFSARVDVEQALIAFGPAIDIGFAQFEGSVRHDFAPGDAAAQILMEGSRWVREMFDSLETIDAGFALDGSRAELWTSLALDPLTRLGAPNLRARTFDARLLQRLPLTSAIRAIANVDVASLVEFGRALSSTSKSTSTLVSTPASNAFGTQRSVPQLDLARLAPRFEELLPQLDGSLCLGYDFGDDGLSMCAIVGTHQPQHLADAYMQVLGDLASAVPVHDAVTVASPQWRDIDAVPFRETRLNVDLAKLSRDEELSTTQRKELRELQQRIYGKDGMRIAVGARGEELVMGANASDEALRRAIGAGAVADASEPPEFERLRGASSGVWIEIDAARMVSQISRWLPVPLKQPVDADRIAASGFAVQAWCGSKRSQWFGGVALDLDELAAFSAATRTKRVDAAARETDADSERR